MVEIDKEVLNEEPTETDPQPTEAEMAEEANKTITQEVTEFRERKEEADAEVKKAKTELKRKETKEKKEETKEDFLAKSNTVKLDAFIERLKADFNVQVNPTKNNSNEFHVKFDNFLICGLMPRNKQWYGIWREVAEEKNKWKAIKVCNQKDEEFEYGYIKEFIKINSE